MVSNASAQVATIITTEGFSFEYDERDGMYYAFAPGLPFRIGQGKDALLRSFANAAEIIHKRRVLAPTKRRGPPTATERKVVYLRPKSG
jgi:hypothetical protein